MELLIAILMYLGVHATPEMMNNDEFTSKHENEISRAQDMANSGQYVLRDGIVITGTFPLK